MSKPPKCRTCGKAEWGHVCSGWIEVYPGVAVEPGRAGGVIHRKSPLVARYSAVILKRQDEAATQDRPPSSKEELIGYLREMDDATFRAAYNAHQAEYQRRRRAQKKACMVIARVLMIILSFVMAQAHAGEMQETLSLNGGSNGFSDMMTAGHLFLADPIGPYHDPLENSIAPPAAAEPIGNTWIATRGARGFWTTISEAAQDLIDARAICADHRREITLPSWVDISRA